MRAIKISDRLYRNSHMRAPRGRGGWIFAPAGTEALGYSEAHFNVFDRTYTEAVQALRNHVAALRAAGQAVADTWYVLP